jgi:carbonic anhydrase
MGKLDILRLMVGFRKFREKYFENEHPLYQKLSSAGQGPKTLIIGCSDSRVDPAMITSAHPGELFIVRNVANMVPPYETGGGYHGVSAAIEFAVVNLKVENIIVLGHRQCGGIRALMLNDQLKPKGFVEQWVSIAQNAKERVLARYSGADEDTLCKHGEREAIVTSISNLRTFPFVQEALERGDLHVMGIYFDLESGQLLQYDDDVGDFKNIEI